jgi:REP element-mobilizing transposase RayT
MPSKLLKTPVLPDKYYHIFNQAINKEKIFKEYSDYQFFLAKLRKLVTSNIDIYAFCLLPNHFHLLIKPKPLEKVIGCESTNESLRKFLQIYVQYFNKKYKRRGSLFLKSFRRIEISDDAYLKYLVFYIHYNPQKHSVIKDFAKYEFSSYQIFFRDQSTNLRRKEVLAWFNNSLEDLKIHHLDCIERRIGIEPGGTPTPGMESHF